MKLYTVQKDDSQIVAVEGKDEKLYSVNSLGVPAADMNALIKGWAEFGQQLQTSLAAINSDSLSAKPLEEYKVLAPIPAPLQDVVCIGVNYHDHKKEAAEGIDFVKKAETVYFSKRVSAANGPDGVIPVYDFVDSLDYEVELGVILGQDAFKVSPEEAHECIFGYTVINDVTARNIQKSHQQWYFGKSLDGYTPIGPCIVTADEIGDPHDLSIRLYVNGELRQDSNTKYMITTAEEAISELSQGITLQKCTILASGTPAGVGMGMKPPVWLKSGDKVRCEIENIGVLENIVG